MQPQSESWRLTMEKSGGLLRNTKKKRLIMSLMKKQEVAIVAGFIRTSPIPQKSGTL
jgi:hypothetical protein